MHAKKRKAKDRRRARKLADQAWDAADQDNHQLALKIIDRAVALIADNPVLWNDQGLLRMAAGDDEGAAESFQAAISLAPNFAEPYGHLAAIRLRQGGLNEALALQRQAVKHDPESQRHAEQLSALLAMTGQQDAAEEREAPAAPIVPQAPTAISFYGRESQYDWEQIDQSLTSHGWATAPKLLSEEQCRDVRDLFDRDDLFSQTVVMDKRKFGKGRYRYFASPLPGVVQTLREAMYSRLVETANHWQTLLGLNEHFPPNWEAFQAQCARAGQTTPSPLLLRYGSGGFNYPHRDLRGEVYFPIQLAVTLSRRVESSPGEGEFVGGDFLFCDVRQGKTSRRRRIPLSLGDAVFFCTRDRLVDVAGAYGLQPARHGAAELIAGERMVLGLPFHDFRT